MAVVERVPDLSWLIAEPLFWTLTTGPSVAVGALTRRAGFAAATAGLALVTTGVAAVALEGYDITTYLAFIGLALVLAAAAAEVIGVALRAARARSVGAWGTIGLAVPAGIMLTGLVKVSGIGPFSLLRDTLIEKWPGRSGWDPPRGSGGLCAVWAVTRPGLGEASSLARCRRHPKQPSGGTT